jgi:hypothetical protein
MLAIASVIRVAMEGEAGPLLRGLLEYKITTPKPLGVLYIFLERYKAQFEVQTTGKYDSSVEDEKQIQ